MLNQDAFLSTVTKLEAQGKDLELVLKTWLRCEDAMLKKSSQEPVLFTSNQIWFDEVADQDVVQLEVQRSDLQSMKSLLEYLLSSVEIEKKNLKQEADFYWQAADKNSSNGKYAFKRLNAVRNLQREYKRKANKMANIQSLIKNALNS